MLAASEQYVRDTKVRAAVAFSGLWHAVALFSLRLPGCMQAALLRANLLKHDFMQKPQRGGGGGLNELLDIMPGARLVNWPKRASTLLHVTTHPPTPACALQAGTAGKAEEASETMGGALRGEVVAALGAPGISPAVS